jgi:hypothetical protein
MSYPSVDVSAGVSVATPVRHDLRLQRAAHQCRAVAVEKWPLRATT